MVDYQRYVKVRQPDGERRRRIHYCILLGIFVIAILGVCVFSVLKKNSRAPLKANYHENSDYKMQLAENLEKLAHLSRDPVFHKTSLQPRKPVQRSHITRRYLMRQNAPTKAYAVQYANRSADTLLDHTPYAKFANKTTQVPHTMAVAMDHPSYTVPQGEFLHAVLETAIDSDLPGLLRAVIMRPVYSYTNDRLLIPKGSRLIGQYSSMTLHGVNRVMVIWTRVLLPSGVSVQIDSPGTDVLGRSGVAADVIRSHFLARFGEAALLSVIAAGSATVGVNSSTSDNAAQNYRSEISNAFQQSASNALQNSQSIKPSLYIHQGALINVFVAQDLDFYTAVSGVKHGV